MCPLQPFAAVKGILNLEESCFTLSCVICLLPLLPLARLEGGPGGSNPRGSWVKQPPPPKKTNGRLLLHSLGWPQDVTDDEVRRRGGELLSKHEPGGGFFFISPTAATLSPLRLIDVTAFGGKEN